jgi:hypothetical protein
MTEPYVGERFDPSTVANETEKYPNSASIDGEPVVENGPAVEPYFNETSIADVEETEETIPKAHADDNLDPQEIADVVPQGELATTQVPVQEALNHEAVYSPETGVTSTTLLNHEDSEHFRTRWNEIQGKFVDEPRSAVQQADALVSEVVAQMTRMFASEHTALEVQWNQGSGVSTEDLRKALQHYRAFFNRLVV